MTRADSIRHQVRLFEAVHRLPGMTDDAIVATLAEGGIRTTRDAVGRWRRGEREATGGAAVAAVLLAQLPPDDAAAVVAELQAGGRADAQRVAPDATESCLAISPKLATLQLALALALADHEVTGAELLDLPLDEASEALDHLRTLKASATPGRR